MRRTALITGASAGLGREFARQLAARGWDLLLVARRADRLKEVAEEVASAHGVAVETLAADLARREAPEEVVAFARERGLQVDYLVNNAGSAGPELLDVETSFEQQAAFFELMMLSVAHLCHLFVPGMRERADMMGAQLNVRSRKGAGTTVELIWPAA